MSAVPSPVNQARLVVRHGPLVGAVLSRVVGMLAARALCPIDRLDDALLITDAIADVLWTPSPDADENLLAEGVAPERITRVGNVMMDSFELVRPAIEAADRAGKLGLAAGGYGVVTLHRPSNVDDPAQLGHERGAQLGRLAGFAVEVGEDRFEGGGGIEHAPR